MPQFLEKIELSEKELKLIAGFVYDKFGIVLNENKSSLITGRLQKVIKDLGLRSFTEYYEYVSSDKSGKALSTLIDRISTNHTYFFRESDHFNFFSKRGLPEIGEKLKNRTKKEIRIWSAGCSTGEEPYTLMILAEEFMEMNKSMFDISYLATDVSLQALTEAHEGVYPDREVQKVPEELLNKYFIKSNDKMWKIRSEYKSRILFRKLNLMDNMFPFKKKFHMIFCRNVMIYFDQATRKKLIEKFFNVLDNDGYLFIGHSETISRTNPLFEFVGHSIYRKK